ncbi:hypothetical protein [Chondromyces crocatus]|uniref:PEGA domain-containing protein n=1 Tax=Chondromyces crocatus TaxID=52 RepID=A0A0K1ESE5_CHOCO|nr:hypothetical protein [Chondromyces crocatus]AKT43543.1 uncharacterized protein CMC5_077750 [Chondromyces crocatus]
MTHAKPKPPPLALAVALTPLLLAAAPLEASAAPTKRQCAAAYEDAQSLRQESKLQAAREKALLCASDACPAVVRGDCARWHQEIEASQPTVVFHVKDTAGKETASVRLHIDGQLVRERLEGTAIPVDPGEHLLRFEIDGADPIEQRQVIREGEKLRAISVSFAPEPTASPPSPSASESPPPDHRGPPALAWILGGVGVAGLGVGATFGLLGLSQKGDLEDTCAPRCSSSDIGAVRSKLIVSDIGFGVGIVSLGVATILFLTSGSSSEPSADARRPPSLDIAFTPLTGGGFAGLSGTF